MIDSTKVHCDNKPNILIIGATGSIGAPLHRHLSSCGYTTIGTTSKADHCSFIKFDLLVDDIDLFSGIENIDICIFLASKCSNSYCKLNPKDSYHFNVTKTIEVFKKLRTKNIKIIFSSSDAVFDGRKGNYSEDDLIAPNTAYGEQKVEVEEFLNENIKNSLIMRLAKNYSSDRNDNSLFSLWLRQLQNNEVIKVFSDQYFNPIYVKDTCAIIEILIDKKKIGIYHISQPIRFSRLPLLKKFANHMEIHDFQVEEILTESLSLPDVYAKDASLNNEKLLSEIDIEFSPLEEIFEAIKSGKTF
jgi:dTDP-4-dehydrorhamnose reductase